MKSISPRRAPAIAAALLPLAGLANGLSAADTIVVINEVHYHPPGEGTEALEFVELYNQNTADVDLSGWRLEGLGGGGFEIPEDTVIPGRGYLVVARDPAALAEASGYSGALGPFAGALANGGELLVLRNHNGRAMDELDFGDDAPWPVGADGSGATLSKLDAMTPGGDPRRWRTSAQLGGTPGAVNFPGAAGETGGGDPGPGGGSAGPVARYFPFNGDGDDVSGNGVHAETVGAVFENPGAPGAGTPGGGANRALHLDGNDDRAEIPDPPDPTSYSLAAWVYPERATAQSILVRTNSAGPGNAWSHQLRITTAGRFEHYTFDGSQRSVTGTTPVVPGRWYHVAATAAGGGRARLYVDGVEEGTPADLGTPWQAGDRWIVGQASGHGMGFFRGRVDDLAIWHRELGPDEVARLASGRGDPLTRLVNVALGRPVIDGSSAYNNQPFDQPNNPGQDFTAGNVTDGSTRDVFGENYWLGSNGDPTEYFTLDLGAVYPLEEIHLRNTHNTQFNDRGTLDFRLSAAGAADGANRLLDPRVILEGRLDAVPGLDPIPAEIFTAGADLPDDVSARFLRFDTLSAVQNNAGLNEIEVYVREEDADAGDPGPGAETAEDIALAIAEMAGADTPTFWVELHNAGDTPQPLAGFVLAASGGGSAVLAGEALAPGGRAVFDAATLGFAPGAGEKLFLYTPGGSALVDAATVKRRPRARLAAEPHGPFFIPSVTTPGEANEFSFADAVVINEIMYHHRPDYRVPGVPDTYRTEALVPWDAAWRYDASGQDLGSAWREPDFDDAGWASGPGVLAVEDAALAHPVGTELDLGPLTFYFRTTFTLGAGVAGTQLQLDLMVDDAAAVYLNGTEVFRTPNLPAGADFRTTATTTVGNAAPTGRFAVPPGALVEGVNVLAAEVHQGSLISSDVVFGLELVGQVVVEPGIPGVPFRESDEEWIELYNRSAEAVDLGGWELDGGARFTFPEGTMLAPGAYLVVARDPAALAALHPGISVMGDLRGRLSDRGDRIVLRDAVGNPADEVEFCDDAPRPGRPYRPPRRRRQPRRRGRVLRRRPLAGLRRRRRVQPGAARPPCR